MKRLALAGVLLFVAAGPVWGAGPVYELETGTDTALASAGLGLYGLGYLVDRSYEPLTAAEIDALDPRTLNSLDRTAVDNWSPAAGRASDYLVMVSAATPLALLAGEQGRAQSDVLGVMYVETMVLGTGLTYLLKNTFGRTRPFVYGDSPDIPRRLKMSRTARRSFPSGHTTTAFAALVFTASVFGRMYPDDSARTWVWGGCLAAAGTTGYLRYRAGMHFPTDILAGATIGAFAGWVVPQLHEWSPVPADGAQKFGGGGQAAWGLTLGF